MYKCTKMPAQMLHVEMLPRKEWTCIEKNPDVNVSEILAFIPSLESSGKLPPFDGKIGLNASV